MNQSFSMHIQTLFILNSVNFIMKGFGDDLFSINFSQILRCPFNGWIKDSCNVWNNIWNYFFTFSNPLFGFFFKGHHLSVCWNSLFFLPSTSLIFSPFPSSGFSTSLRLLPTSLNWVIFIHLFNECTLNFTPCQVLFYHNPDSLPAFMVINFNKGGRSWAANTLFKLRSLPSIKRSETGYRRGGWQGASPRDGQESSPEMIGCSEKTPSAPGTHQVPPGASASSPESGRWAQGGPDRWPRAWGVQGGSGDDAEVAVRERCCRQSVLHGVKVRIAGLPWWPRR